MKYLKVVYNSWFPWRGCIAITLLRWCVVRKNEKDKFTNIIYNHENIHYAQERELWYIGFYLLYLLSFLWELRCMNINHAYRNIVFEREAYAHQEDFNYLPNRKKFAWRKEKRNWRI